MTSFFKYGAAIRALQESVAALSAQLAAAREQSATETARYERLSDKVAELAVLVSSQADALQHQAERVTQLREEGAQHDERLSQLRHEVTEQLARLRDDGQRQGGEVERLGRDVDSRFDRWREESDRREEYAKRLRADLERMERQAAIDLDAMRRTGSALAEALLLGRHRTAVEQS